MISITEEQFFDSVDTWIYHLTGHGRDVGCGFCKAKFWSDEGCCVDCLAFEICVGSGDTAYRRFVYSTDSVEKEQAELEIFEWLYELGVKLGFYKEALRNELE